MCYCDIFTVSLKYFFYLRHFKLDFFTLHYITLQYHLTVLRQQGVGPSDIPNDYDGSPVIANIIVFYANAIVPLPRGVD